MVQANELGLHAIGIDVSAFNALIGNCKVMKYDLVDVQTEITRITRALKTFLANSHTLEFEEKLLQALYDFNNKYFPVPDYKYKVHRGEIDENIYGEEKARDFLSTYERLVKEYNIKLKQDKADTFQYCLTGDSRTIDIFGELEKRNVSFAGVARRQKIKGIFSSPPYVGLIDYHEQHAYAYDLFGFKRQDELEIGPLFKGQGREAKQRYIQGITDVLNNCKKYLVDDYDIFLVANDKCNMYPTLIAIPYNPYEPQPYNRWTMRGMLDLDHELKVSNEFWDFLGGSGAYLDLLDIFERIGIELRTEIDEYFAKYNKR